MIPNTFLVLAPDLEEARAFYADALGFALKQDLGDHLVFALTGAELHVFQAADPAPRGDHGSFAATVLVFEVEDVAAKMAEMRGKGVVFLHTEPAQNSLLRYAAFRAPGGNVHEICERLKS